MEPEYGHSDADEGHELNNERYAERRAKRQPESIFEHRQNEQADDGEYDRGDEPDNGTCV